MKRLFLTLFLCLFALSATAQSRSVERFRDRNKPTLKLFFYESTLKMLSRIDLKGMSGSLDSEFGEMPALAEMIKGIEKVKFFMYEDYTFEGADDEFKQLKHDVADEGYETMMSARADGNNMEVLMKERRGEPEGFVVLIKMEDGYSIIDIEGYPDVNNILKFSEFINKSSSNLTLKDAFN